MPKYFKTKNEQLHAEALATLMILSDRFDHYCCDACHSNFDKLAVAVRKASNRVYRRWCMAYGS